jgi:hypothetical protein
VVGCKLELYEPCVSLSMDIQTLAPLLRQVDHPERAAPGPQLPLPSTAAATAPETSTASMAAIQASSGGTCAVSKDAYAKRTPQDRSEAVAAAAATTAVAAAAATTAVPLVQVALGETTARRGLTVNSVPGVRLQLAARLVRPNLPLARRDA